MPALQITLTDAGIAEITNAESNGTAPVVIAEVGIGTGQYTPDPTQTQLSAEVKRLSSIAGEVVADDVIHVTIKDDSLDAYTVSEFGLYTASGTLFAVYSEPAEEVMQKTAYSSLLLAVDIAVASINAASVTFGDSSFSLGGFCRVGESDSFPAGTTMVFVQETAPVGWTKVTDHDNKALRIVNDDGGAGGGTVNFTDAFKSQSISATIGSTTAGGAVTVNNHTLTTSHIPSHNHTARMPTSRQDTWNEGGNNATALAGENTGSTSYYGSKIGNTGSGGAHNHSASFAGSAHSHSFNGTALNLAVKYVNAIIATKD